LTFPETEKIPGPVDFSVPIEANHSGPRLMMWGTQDRVSTLLITVGLLYRPSTAGKGGRSLGWPRYPSNDSRSAVSSPQM
jgi:hypothetical protein